MLATNLAISLRGLWRLALGHGLDADTIFRDNGLNPLLMSEHWGRYPAKGVHNAWLEVSAQTGNPHVSLEIPNYYNPLDYQSLGIGFLSSSTLQDALQRLIRYTGLVSSRMLYTLDENETRCDCLMQSSVINPELVPVSDNYRLALVLTLCRDGLGESLDPVEVSFTYPEPEYLGEHFALFRCPLKFSQPVARLSLASNDLLRPFTTANQDLAESCDKVLDEALENISELDLVSKVKWAIIENLPSGKITEAGIAEAVLVSSRTMHRKLGQAGTNYRALLEGIRSELAVRYIVDKKIPLTEVSYLLGFSSLSSFSRAFKRWNGESPVAFRNRNRNRNMAESGNRLAGLEQ